MDRIVFDFKEYRTIEEFHEDVIKKLALTDFYGRNLDAFNDELSSLSKSQYEVKMIYGGKISTAYQDLVYEIIQSNLHKDILI